MTLTITEVVKQFKQDWTAQLEPNAILSACRRVGYKWREHCLNPVVTMHFFFVRILHGNTACTHLRHLTKLAVSASAYCQARMKLPLAIFQHLLRSTCHRLQDERLDEGRWLGHRIFLVDGSSFSMPDTPELQAHFGQPGGQLPGCGFPVAHLMVLCHAASGMILKVLAAPLRTHDLPQVVSLHPELQPTDVLVGDRALCSYAHLALLIQRGVHAVLRMHQKQIVDFTPGRAHIVPGHEQVGQKGKPRSRWTARLGKQDQIIEWLKPTTRPSWMSKEQFDQLPARLRLRELRYRTQRPGFRVQTVTLVTTLLDPHTYSLEALAALYLVRWRAEGGFRFLKDPVFFVSSLFVKKPCRIQGLLMVMTLALLVYSVAQRRLRQALARQNETIANQINQPTSRPTLRWVFQLLEGIERVRVRVEGNVQELITGLNAMKVKILRLFGERVCQVYQLPAG